MVILYIPNKDVFVNVPSQFPVEPSNNVIHSVKLSGFTISAIIVSTEILTPVSFCTIQDMVTGLFKP